MATTTDAVWITSNASGRIARIDPTTNLVTQNIAVGGGLCGIAVDEAGLIWVADLQAGIVDAVDPATGKVVHAIPKLGPQLWDLKAGFGSIWVVDRDGANVLRIDPKSGTISKAIGIGPQGSGLAILSDGVWVSDDADGKIRRIDPSTNTVVATVDIGLAPSWFADDGVDVLMVAQRTGGVVRVLDPITGEPGPPITGWAMPLDGTVVGHTAWIPDGSRSAVLTVDVATGAVTGDYALPGGRNPFVAEFAFGDIWVLDFGSTKVWRIRP